MKKRLQHEQSSKDLQRLRVRLRDCRNNNLHRQLLMLNGDWLDHQLLNLSALSLEIGVPYGGLGLHFREVCYFLDSNIFQNREDRSELLPYERESLHTKY